MKKLGKILVVAVATVLAVGVAGGCNSACADLDKKKADCAKNSDDAAKKICEKIIDEAVKAGNADTCKAALDGINKTTK